MSEKPLEIEVAAEAFSSEPAGLTVTRREALVGLAGLVAGAGGAWLVRGLVTQSPFATARVNVGDVVDLERRIDADGQVLVDAEQLIAIVAWNPSTPYGDGTAANVYGPDGEGHPVTSATTGLMALVLRSTHLRCRVLRCASSGWYEDPCHGSKWNRWGEYAGGPAPRGLDRLESTVGDGQLVLRLSPIGLIPGPSRDTQVLDEPSSGPSCTDG